MPLILSLESVFKTVLDFCILLVLPVLGTIPALQSAAPATASCHLEMFQGLVQLLTAFPVPCVYLLSSQFPVWLSWHTDMATPPGAVKQVSLADLEIQAEVSNLQPTFLQSSPSTTYRIVTDIPSLLIDDKAAGVWLLVISQSLLINVAVKLPIFQLSGPCDWQKNFIFLFLKKKNRA